MIQVGSKIRIINKPDSCCGVLQQGWTGVVQDILYTETLAGTRMLLVLQDETVVWSHHTEEIK